MGVVRNQVFHGDVLEQLKKLPKDCAQCSVTSPPYFALRSYLPAEHPDKLKEVGQEADPHEYIDKLVEVLREVRRVLRPDGVLWLNLADTYASDTKNWPGLKPKDLIGIPWRVALALQEDGWWLRSDVIWAKGNPQPEAVQDRPTRSHEYLFMFTRSQNYYYDPIAICEPTVQDETGRNKRSVWNINAQPYRGAHFATMPEEIPRLCIRASTSEKGACSACGAPWKRIIERGESHYAQVKGDRHWTDLQEDALKKGWVTRGGPTLDAKGTMPSLYAAPRRELGWTPTCECPERDKPVPCLVLDPFAGSGTTLAVAKKLGRDYVGVELNSAYLPLIEERVRKPTEWQEDRDVFELMMGLDDG